MRPLGHPLPHPRTALPLIDFSRYIALLCAVHECTAVALCCCCCCSCFSLLLWLLFLFLHDQVPHGDKSWTDANPEPRPVCTAVLPLDLSLDLSLRLPLPPHVYAPPFPHMKLQSDPAVVNQSFVNPHSSTLLQSNPHLNCHSLVIAPDRARPRKNFWIIAGKTQTLGDTASLDANKKWVSRNERTRNRCRNQLNLMSTRATQSNPSLASETHHLCTHSFIIEI